MVELYQEDGIIVEPAGCLGICGLDSIKDLKGKKVVCIVSGGNNDIMRYPETIQTTFLPFKSFIESKPQIPKQPAGSTIIPSS
jgi:threonine dehydratase